MGQNQDDDNDEDKEPTFSEVKAEQRDYIAWLRKGGKESRRLAKVLAPCRRGNRCNHRECKVCARLTQRAARRIGSVIEVIYGNLRPSLQVREVLIEAVKVNGKRRTLNEAKLIAIAASMSQVGLRMPITVREEKKKAVLVCGWYRLEAARRIGWKTIPCFIIVGNEIETRPWELAENLYRAELTVLERAEHIDELRTIIRRKLKGGQVAPPGGGQPRDVGINKTAKALGFTKEEIRRAKAIAEISAKAKEKAKNIGLNNNQDALLEIAKLPTPESQCKALRAIEERKRAARARRAAAAVAENDKAGARIQEIEASIADKLRRVDSLNNKVATQRERVREIEDKLIGKSVDATLAPVEPSPPIVPADDSEQLIAAPDPHDSSALDTDCDQALAALETAWRAAVELRHAWDQAPTVVRERFIAEVLRGYVS